MRMMMTNLRAGLLAAALALMALAQPAAAVNVDCRDTKVLGAFMEGGGRNWQTFRLLVGAFNENMRRAESYQLVMYSSRKPSWQNDAVTMWTTLFCQARRNADPAALALEQRWKGVTALGDRLTIAALMKHYLDRAKAGVGALQVQEKQLLADTLAYLAAKVGGVMVGIAADMRGRYGLAEVSR
ncbi:MAG: hypothetical protein EBQ80_00190 [Proteobacteria bacterium]|nr:hypothetical protein [Pseudomonadota bacterium]